MASAVSSAWVRPIGLAPARADVPGRPELISLRWKFSRQNEIMSACSMQERREHRTEVFCQLSLAPNDTTLVVPALILTCNALNAGRAGTME